MALERIVVKETQFQEHLDDKLLQRWAEGQDVQLDSLNSPLMEVDLSPHGYGKVIIQDESTNPTGTIKDHMALAIRRWYRIFAQAHLKQGYKPNTKVPRISILTAGNAGKSLVNAFKDIMPIKLLVDNKISPALLRELCQLDADIYQADMREPLTSEQIKKLTNNQCGIELTGRHSKFYLSHARMVIGLRPAKVYAPYGSGQLFDNYLDFQIMDTEGTITQREKPASICGAEPEQQNSMADKLTAHCKPFVIYGPQKIQEVQKQKITGDFTGVYGVNEEYIKNAWQRMNELCPAEPSGAAGLALYMQHYDQGLIHQTEKIVVVNTGKGK